MRRIHKWLVMLLVLLLVGGMRLRFEHRLLDDFRSSGLVRQEVNLDTRDKIDQTSLAVALGGLRTLVATFMNLRALTLFEEQRWDELEESYNTIVDLAPHTRYYWEVGAWHLSYNAASHYIHDSDLPSLRRRELWRSFVHRGRDFLERGIRYNPGDWSLQASLAHMLRDPYKLLAFSDRESCLASAAAAYEKAIELGGNAPRAMQRFRLYALARIEGRRDEALAVARELHANPRNRKPTLLTLLYVLECHADPDADVEALALRIFGDADRAYKALSRLWQRNRDGYPLDGVTKGIVRMEQLLGIPMVQSALAQQPAPPPSLDDLFENDL